MKKICLLLLLCAIGIQAADDPMGELLGMMIKGLREKIEAAEAKQDEQKKQKESCDPFKNTIKKGDCAQIANHLDECGNEIPDYAVHTAIKSKQQDVLRLLIARGADINQKYKGRTPLYEAVKHPEVLELLLNAGALIESLDEEFGETPLHIACELSAEDACRKLLSRNASVRARNYYNQTSLHSAAFAGSKVIMEQLIAAKSQINAREENGYTPLMKSIAQKHQEAALYLIDAGAAVDVQDKGGDTALHYASGHMPNIVIARALLAHKANVCTTNKKKCTPLHMAAHAEMPEIVQELITHGADVWAADADGQWPLERAKTREVKQLLIDVMKSKN